MGRLYRPPSEAPKPEVDEEGNEVEVVDPVQYGRVYVGVTEPVTPQPEEAVVTVTEPELVVPDGTDEDRVVWVSEAGRKDERSARASAIYQHAVDSGSTQEDLDALGALLRAAVYGKQLEEPAGNASTEAWAEYARSKGALEADLVDEQGNALGREALREKYGSASS